MIGGEITMPEALSIGPARPTDCQHRIPENTALADSLLHQFVYFIKDFFWPSAMSMGTSCS
jgi:hypothetical protein